MVPAAHLSVAMSAGAAALEMRPRFTSPLLKLLLLLLLPMPILPGEGDDIERRRRRRTGAGARRDSMRCDAMLELNSPELPFPLTSRFLLPDPLFKDEWLSRGRAAASDGDELTETGRMRRVPRPRPREGVGGLSSSSLPACPGLWQLAMASY